MNRRGGTPAGGNCIRVGRGKGGRARWVGLAETGAAGVRHCGVCARDVYFCETDEETLGHARAGHCVARERPAKGELSRVYVGRPAVREPVTAEQETASRMEDRERAIDDSLKNLHVEGKCERCGYPVPPYRGRCRVCWG